MCRLRRAPEMYGPFLERPVLAHAMAFMLNDSAARRIIWSENTESAPILTFDAMADFLERGGDISTSSWKMADK